MRGDVVLQALELAREGPRKKPAEDAEHLPELDEHAAEPEHAVKQALGVAVVHLVFVPTEPGGQALVSPADDTAKEEIKDVACEDRPEEPQRADEAERHRIRWSSTTRVPQPTHVCTRPRFASTRQVGAVASSCSARPAGRPSTGSL